MKVIFSEEARTAFDGILGFIGSNYPTAFASFQKQFTSSMQRIAECPESARRVDRRADVRVVPLTPYPYKLFYRYRPDLDLVEIVDIRHMARSERHKVPLDPD
jgi:plasmid stabilization system protein ParE